MNFFNGNYEVIETSRIIENGNHKFMWFIAQSQSRQSMFYLAEINVLNREDAIVSIPFELEGYLDSSVDSIRYNTDVIDEYVRNNIFPNPFM